MQDATYIRELVSQTKEPKTYEVGGRHYLALPPGWTEQHRKPGAVASLKVCTLTGLLDYLAHEPVTKGIIHVESPTLVSVRGPIEEEEATEFRRQTFLVATTEQFGAPFRFGVFQGTEEFMIGLQTAFVRDAILIDFMALVAGIRDGATVTLADDGISQSVTVQQGVSYVGEKKVPSPVTLAPYRTFAEIDQPASPFVVRLQRAQREGGLPQVALFEADGQRWKLEAIQKIAAFLQERTAGHVGDQHASETLPERPALKVIA